MKLQSEAKRITMATFSFHAITLNTLFPVHQTYISTSIGTQSFTQHTNFNWRTKLKPAPHLQQWYRLWPWIVVGIIFQRSVRNLDTNYCGFIIVQMPHTNKPSMHNAVRFFFNFANYRVTHKICKICPPWNQILTYTILVLIAIICTSGCAFFEYSICRHTS